MLGDQGLFLLAIANLKLLLFEVVMHLLVYFMIVLENSNSFASLNYSGKIPSANDNPKTCLRGLAIE